MSGSKPSRKPAWKQASSHSFGRTPGGNSRSKAPDCDRGTQPCAEFHGKRRTIPSYAASHSHFTNDSLDPYKRVHIPGVNDRYVKRKPLPLPANNRRSGVVGPEPDYSVRGRNLPIIFCKQIRHAAELRYTRDSAVYRTVIFLFTGDDRTLYGEERPNAGCHQTRKWSDTQVLSWTSLAHWLGIEFSGDREYSFPKGSLGVHRYGSYHAKHSTLGIFPWPKEDGSQEPCIPPKFYFPSAGKRSEFSRIKRSLKKIKKMDVTPFDFQSNLVVRRSMSSRKIRSEWRDSGMHESYQEYRDKVPKILSLNTKRPCQVPQIVLDSLKRIASRCVKLLPGSPWIVSPDSPVRPKYSLSVQCPPDKRVNARLKVYLSRDGNAYLLPTGNDGRVNLLVGRKDLTVSQYMNVLQHASKLQRDIDLSESEGSDIPSTYPATLGSWEDW